MKMITADQVKAAMTEKKIDWVPSHDCALCGTVVGWERHGDHLAYQSSCDCCHWHPPVPRDWQDAADHINRQTRTSERFGDIKANEAAKFGITLEPLQAA
jgi:hypothetical protein